MDCGLVCLVFPGLFGLSLPVFYRMDGLVSFGFLKDSDVGFLFFRIMDQKRFFWIVDLGFGFSQRIG
jgi:hypothetical protein